MQLGFLLILSWWPMQMKRFVICCLSFQIISHAAQVFLIYSDLQSTNHPESPSSGGHRGLGYVDSHKDTLDVRFELKPSHIVESELTILGRTGKNNKPTRKSRKVKEEAVKVVDITLYQDKTALRSRKGDTGSVLWKARCVVPRSSSCTYPTLYSVSISLK